MVYVGGKSRIAKHIMPIILEGRKKGQTYVEPFCGGCNSLEHATGKRKAYDVNKYLIAMWKELQQGWVPPTYVSKQDYITVRNNKENFPEYFVGYLGFNCAFRSKFFSGYSNIGKCKLTHQQQKHNNIMKQIPKLKGVKFECKSFLELDFNDCVIYCDPPYFNTGKVYGINSFDTESFWMWVRKQSKNNTVFVSEKIAPDDFECVWEKEIQNGLSVGKDNKTIKEKLFKLKTK
jgi:DNA adenine methylase